MIKTIAQIQDEIANKVKNDAVAAEVAIRFITEQAINDQLYQMVESGITQSVSIDVNAPELLEFVGALDQETVNKIVNEHVEALTDGGWDVAAVDGKLTVQTLEEFKAVDVSPALEVVPGG